MLFNLAYALVKRGARARGHQCTGPLVNSQARRDTSVRTEENDDQ